MRMIPEHNDIFGSDPKLQFNFFCLTVHNTLPTKNPKQPRRRQLSNDHVLGPQTLQSFPSILLVSALEPAIQNF
jgi:hypothetical protein